MRRFIVRYTLEGKGDFIRTFNTLPEAYHAAVDFKQGSTTCTIGYLYANDNQSEIVLHRW